MTLWNFKLSKNFTAIFFQKTLSSTENKQIIEVYNLSYFRPNLWEISWALKTFYSSVCVVYSKKSKQNKFFFVKGSFEKKVTDYLSRVIHVCCQKAGPMATVSTQISFITLSRRSRKTQNSCRTKIVQILLPCFRDFSPLSCLECQKC